LDGHHGKRDEWQYRQVSFDDRFHGLVPLVRIG